MREIKIDRVGPRKTETIFDKVFALPDNEIDLALQEGRCIEIPGHDIIDGIDCSLISKLFPSPTILDRDIFAKESQLPFRAATVLECYSHELGDVAGRLYLIFDTKAEATKYKLAN